MLSLKESDSDSPNLLELCPSHASHARLTRARVGGNWPVSDPMICRGSDSCKLRSPILSAMKSRDRKTNLEPGKNLFVESNSIDLT
jgi:hypothetical protein